ncbi:hypothetical protein AAV99_11085 [Aurantiacibacter marinus]|uniref:Uncharacterized protein n=1 Tax=Aurantiacibacter marinus TaxID=874156 RepID=A0A0H0XLG8_9SPHN|nr:hypothetical protein AAV99_11085 [Aurantiacibacter marinus]
MEGRADIVIADRGVAENAHLSPLNWLMQRVGSGVAQGLASTQVNDAVSVFRAISRDAMWHAASGAKRARIAIITQLFPANGKRFAKCLPSSATPVLE